MIYVSSKFVHREKFAVNGRWSKWGSWSKCSKTCGSGKKYRTRTCTNPRPANGGQHCKGSSKQSHNCCIKHSCAGKTYCRCTYAPMRLCTYMRLYAPVRLCACAPMRFTIRYSFLVAVNGGWTSWSSWCKCSKTCGAGLQYRRRYCTKPKPAHGGKPCKGKNKLIKTCHLIACIRK